MGYDQGHSKYSTIPSSARKLELSLSQNLTSGLGQGLFTNSLTFDEYLKDILVISAVERQFEVLGEAARRISIEFQRAHPEIDWQRIIGLRNIIAHRYDEVRQEILWTIISAELTPLLTQLEALLPPLPEDNEL